MYFITRNGKLLDEPIIFRSWVVAEWWVSHQDEERNYGYKFILNLRKF